MRASPVGGEQRVEHRGMVTLRPGKWLNDNIINFVGKAFIQPWRGQCATKTHVFSSHWVDKLLNRPDPEDPYNFAAVRKWCDRVAGGMAALEELLIPKNANGNH